MENQPEKSKILSLKFLKRIVLILVIILIFDFLFFITPTLASETEEYLDNNINAVETTIEPFFPNGLPENRELEIKYIGNFHITAYTSEVAQCDGAPCLTANGFNLCEYGIEDSIAANFLPFGAKVRLPELFGDKVFIVRDRMNARYSDWIDIWMIDKQDAKNFGVKITKVEIFR